MREKLTKYFDNKGCINSPDLADETINRVARKIDEGEYIEKNAFSYYFYGVAKNVLREYLNSPERENVSIDSLCLPLELPEPLTDANLSFSQNLDPNLVFDCLEVCLEKLAEEEREIILKYYEGEGGDKIENRRQLADKLQLNLNNLRIRAFRIRHRLEKCVDKCTKPAKKE